MHGPLKIERLFAFIVVDDDGSEGVPSFPGPDGTIVPLMGADMKRVESLRPMALWCAQELQRPVQLAVFERRVDREVIYPAEGWTDA